MINIVDDMLAKHSDAEIIEFLYGEISEVARIHKLTSDNKLSAEYLWVTTHSILEIRDILRALRKRNQERQVQTDNFVTKNG